MWRRRTSDLQSKQYKPSGDSFLLELLSSHVQFTWNSYDESETKHNDIHKTAPQALNLSKAFCCLFQFWGLADEPITEATVKAGTSRTVWAKEFTASKTSRQNLVSKGHKDRNRKRVVCGVTSMPGTHTAWDSVAITKQENERRL